MYKTTWGPDTTVAPQSITPEEWEELADFEVISNLFAEDYLAEELDKEGVAPNEYLAACCFGVKFAASVGSDLYLVQHKELLAFPPLAFVRGAERGTLVLLGTDDWVTHRIGDCPDTKQTTSKHNTLPHS